MKKLLTCFMCIMMLVGISGCGSDESKSDKTDKPKTEEKTDAAKKDEGSLAEKKKLKEMAPDPNDMLGDARISEEGYNKKSNTYYYKVENCLDDSFYNKYMDSCKESGKFNGDMYEDIDEDKNNRVYKATTEDNVYAIAISYYPTSENEDGWLLIQVFEN